MIGRFAPLLLFPLLSASVSTVLAQPPSAAEQAELDSVFETLNQAEEGLDALRAAGLIDVDESSVPSPFPEGWPDLSDFVSMPPIRSVVHPVDRSIRLVTTTLRHTTIQLPSEEQIIDYVVGDALYFDLRGADNVAYVKAMAANRRTQVSLVTDWNRTYSFDVFATEAVRPDEVLNVAWQPIGSLPGSPGSGLLPGFGEAAFTLDFVPRDSLDDLRRQIDLVFDDLGRIEEDAARQLSRVEELSDRRADEFLRTYPRRVLPRYRLTPEIQASPLSIHQIWTDDRWVS